MNEDPRVLSAEDIPAAMRLKEAAGWNQTSQDWQNLLTLAPDGCFGMDCDGALRATTTAICYGSDLAWIGMVLTDPAYRGRGLARRLMTHALRFLEARAVRCIKLDATEMAQRLYAQLAFEDECRIERWKRSVGPAVKPPDLPLNGDFPLDLDREAFGADRSDLLKVLAANAPVATLPDGYAMGRPGSEAAYFGPCVSGSKNTARDLLSWWLSRNAGKDVFWDILPPNRNALDLAREFGFEPMRRLARMRRAAAPFVSRTSHIFAAAGFEYG